MKKYISLFSLLIIFTIANSCEKVFLGPDIDNTPRSNFSYLWQKVEMGYSFFDIKDVDWDSIYYHYSPLVTNDMNKEELFNRLAEMLNELKDGHVNLYSPFKTSRYDVSMLGNVNIDFRLIKDYYLTNGIEITGPFAHGFLQNHNIGYIRYASFSNALTNTHFEYMLNRYEDTHGIIFDIRQNGGGYIENVFKILSRLIDQKTIIYYSRIKTGYIGIDDSTFSAPEAVFVTPANGSRYLKPVVVLQDRGSYSAASFFAVSCLALPSITLMGDTTGGGLGLPNGGQLPNGWTYRFSVTRTLSVDGKNWENGVPPDQYITLSPDHNVTGIDDILEAAIERILHQ
jgi:hypothetical protein